MKHAAVTVGSLLLPVASFAHPGHGVGGGDWGAVHYLTEPLHGLGVLAGGALAALVAAWLFRQE